ncbi:hypothetical protein BJP37_09875 [Moorena bouillonii PNG]|uniref:Uncharacterized protein n=1 Tax=Moorena bouillonii PNG TaxID=568701 RepID=A0A1U7N028_9CYAN|nr:hypothetical protein [Moorena bouillonii]OLT59306.1 hypothetical protein BJP37_09875 [Moorena bouillonii PNG]
MSSQRIAAKPKLVIEVERREKQYWKNLWRYRELFYKDWFKHIFDSESVEVEIEDQCLRDYGNSQYRFTVFIYK